VIAGGAALPPPGPLPLPVPGRARWGRLGSMIARTARVGEHEAEEPDPRRAFLDRDRLPARLLVRAARSGDRFRPAGASGERGLFSWLKDRGVPRSERTRTAVACDAEADERIVWVAGHCPRRGLTADAATQSVLVLEWRPTDASGADQ
jgi:tRNA(Ile)-lysidine synthetase-like protein